MNSKLRATLLIGSLALTLGAVRWADTLTNMSEATAGAVAEPTGNKRANPAPAANPQPPALDLGKLRRAPDAGPNGDPFSKRSFRPAAAAPKPVAVVAVAPPPPQAPPLPFAYIGRLSEDNDVTVFLAAGERNLAVKQGDVIDNTYKVEEVGDNSVVLTYLPMSARQVLAIGVE